MFRLLRFQPDRDTGATGPPVARGCSRVAWHRLRGSPVDLLVLGFGWWWEWCAVACQDSGPAERLRDDAEHFAVVRVWFPQIRSGPGGHRVACSAGMRNKRNIRNAAGQARCGCFACYASSRIEIPAPQVRQLLAGVAALRGIAYADHQLISLSWGSGGGGSGVPSPARTLVRPNVSAMTRSTSPSSASGSRRSAPGPAVTALHVPLVCVTSETSATPLARHVADV